VVDTAVADEPGDAVRSQVIIRGRLVCFRSNTDVPFAGILKTTIHTGSFCSYRPDPRFPVTWEF
jgi:hypothetical protein